MIKDNLGTLCGNFDDSDICVECCYNRVMTQQACYKPPVKPQKPSEDKGSIRCRGNDWTPCRAVQTLCEHCPFERECER